MKGPITFEFGTATPQEDFTPLIQVVGEKVRSVIIIIIIIIIINNNNNNQSMSCRQ
jgi:hypothetical protein